MVYVAAEVLATQTERAAYASALWPSAPIARQRRVTSKAWVGPDMHMRHFTSQDWTDMRRLTSAGCTCVESTHKDGYAHMYICIYVYACIKSHHGDHFKLRSCIPNDSCTERFEHPERITSGEYNKKRVHVHSSNCRMHDLRVCLCRGVPIQLMRS